MNLVVDLPVDDLLCSELYIQASSVQSLLAAHRDGQDRNIPPISVYFHSGFGGYIIWDGNARAYVASRLGNRTIKAIVVPPGAEGEEKVLSGLRTALGRGIRKPSDFTPYCLKD